MLLQNLTETNHPSSVQVSLVPEESGEIRIQKLHGKLSETKIRDICDMVISAIDDIRIVSIDEDELLEGNIKKDKKLPLQCSDDERWCRGARIRSDWSSDNWENRNIQGWIWYTGVDTVLGVIYVHHTDNSHKMFINRDIATNPSVTIVLVRKMREKLQKLAPHGII